MKFVLLLGYIAFSFALNLWVTCHHENARWSMLVYLVTAPGCLVIVLVVAVWALPYHWLYPEWHANLIDIKGTDEQKAALSSYRDECAKYGLWRRLLEKVRLRPHIRPQWPELLAMEAADQESDDCSR